MKLKIKKCLSLLLAIIICFTAFNYYDLNVNADGDDRYKIKNIDDQRAVNLNAYQLEEWATEKGYYYQASTVKKNNKDYFMIVVIHDDNLYANTVSKIKPLIESGKTAIKYYAKELIEACTKDLLDSGEKFSLKNDSKEAAFGMINFDYAEGIATDYLTTKYSSSNKKVKLQVISYYLYSDVNKPADMGIVYMSSYGRETGYKTSKYYDDKKNGTCGAYSIKSPSYTLTGKPKKFGYYYKQEIIKDSNDISYWKIEVKPY